MGTAESERAAVTHWEEAVMAQLEKDGGSGGGSGKGPSETETGEE